MCNVVNVLLLNGPFLQIYTCSKLLSSTLINVNFSLVSMTGDEENQNPEACVTGLLHTTADFGVVL